MKANKEYIIPFVGLKLGNNEFDYSIDQKFFDEYEYSLVKNGDVKVHLTFNKHETMFVLDFDIKGTIEVTCDRCLSLFPQEIEAHEQQIVKITDAEFEDDNGEVILINRGAFELDIAPLIYEYINLQAPIITTCDGKQSFCDQSMLDKLNKLRIEDDSEKKTDPRWDALKNFGDN